MLLTLSEAANILLPFVTVLYLTRTLDSLSVGTYLFAWSATFFLSNVIDWGFGLTAVPEISRARAVPERLGAIYGEVSRARLMLMAGATVLYFLTPLALPTWREHWAVFLAMSPALLGAALHPAWFLRGIEKFGPLAAANFVGRGLTTVLVVLLVSGAQDATLAAALTSAGSLVTGVLGQAAIRGELPIKRAKVTIRGAIRRMAASFPVFAATQSNLLTTNFLAVLVGVVGGPYLAGQFGIAFRCLTVLRTLLGVVVQAGLPYVASIVSDDPSAARRLIVRLASIAMPFGILVAIALLVFGPEIVATLFGPGFERSGLLLQILAPIAPLICCSMCLGTIFLLTFEQQSSWVRVTLGATAALVAVIVLLLPWVAIDLAGAIALVVCEVALLIGSVWTFTRKDGSAAASPPGRATLPIRPEVPEFFIIGAPKAGTTSLHAYLGENKKVFMPGLKEPQFFCDDFPGLSQVRGREEYVRLFNTAAPDQIRGEASVWYSYSERAVRTILDQRPDARFILVLRNPVAATISLHAHLIRMFQENVEELDDAWTFQAERAKGQRLPPYCPEARTLLYRRVFDYGPQIDRLFALVPPQQRLVFLTEALIDFPSKVLSEVCSFLGVPFDATQEFPRLNADAELPSLVKRAVSISQGMGLWRPETKMLLNGVGVSPVRLLNAAFANRASRRDVSVSTLHKLYANFEPVFSDVEVRLPHLGARAYWERGFNVEHFEGRAGQHPARSRG